MMDNLEFSRAWARFVVRNGLLFVQPKAPLAVTVYNIFKKQYVEGRWRV